MERCLYVARHGETDWNRIGRWQGHSDVPLNDVGRAQARALAESLRGIKVTAIATSDLSRAHETASIVAAALGIAQLRVDSALRERCYGVFEGLTRADCEERHPAQFRSWMNEPHWVPEGAESLDAVAARVVPAARQVADEFVVPFASALIVTHGGAMRALLRDLCGAAIETIPNTALFRIECHGSTFVRAELV